ncbi:MAG: hypothetical protein ACKPJO_30460 [Dolichospermum sp.]
MLTAQDVMLLASFTISGGLALGIVAMLLTAQDVMLLASSSRWIYVPTMDNSC